MTSSSCSCTDAIARSAAPLLNTPDFRTSFGGLQGTHIPLDEDRLLRTLEMVALPGTRFTRVAETDHPHILCAKTPAYPHREIFVDERFLSWELERCDQSPPRLKKLSCLIQRLAALRGVRYMWGGNWPEGIPLLLEYYPPRIDLSQGDPVVADTWQLKGVDCSGLLYYVSEGIVPRNTSELVRYGRAVPSAGKTAVQISKELYPLDLIVWKGHVVIVLDSTTTIESLLGQGVVTRPLLARLTEIMTDLERLPVDDYPTTLENRGKPFVIRRWHPESL